MMLKAESPQCWKLSSCKTKHLGREKCFLHHMHCCIYMNIILLYPLRGVGGCVLVAEITLFAHAIVQLCHRVSVSRVCLKTSVDDRTALETMALTQLCSQQLYFLYPWTTLSHSTFTCPATTLPLCCGLDWGIDSGLK